MYLVYAVDMSWNCWSDQTIWPFFTWQNVTVGLYSDRSAATGKGFVKFRAGVTPPVCTLADPCSAFISAGAVMSPVMFAAAWRTTWKPIQAFSAPSRLRSIDFCAPVPYFAIASRYGFQTSLSYGG